MAVSVSYRRIGQATMGQLLELEDMLHKAIREWGVKHEVATEMRDHDLVGAVFHAVQTTWREDR